MKAAAEGGNVDLEVAQFALLLERLEADYYVRALNEVPFRSPSARNMASTFADSENQHVDALEQLVRQLSGRAGRAPRFDFGPALTNEDDFLKTGAVFEDTGVSAYNGAGPLIENDEILRDRRADRAGGGPPRGARRADRSARTRRPGPSTGR